MEKRDLRENKEKMLETLDSLWESYERIVTEYLSPDDFDGEQLEWYGLHQWRVNCARGCSDFEGEQN